MLEYLVTQNEVAWGKNKSEAFPVFIKINLGKRNDVILSVEKCKLGLVERARNYTYRTDVTKRTAPTKLRELKQAHYARSTERRPDA